MNPTGTASSFATPSVPRKSRSPSACTVPRTSSPSDVATARQRHAGARDERLEEHVAGAGEQPGPAGRRMEPRLDERPPGLDTLQATPSSPSVPRPAG